MAPRSAPDRIFVGNDIVHLKDARCVGKSRELRFLKRVLSPEEQAWVLGEANADEALWLCWAAKESAYKVVSKCAPSPPVFAHREFVVQVHPEPSRGRHRFDVSGEVVYRGTPTRFEASVTPNRIHAIAWSARDPQRTPSDVSIQVGEASVGRGSRDVDAGLQPFDLLLSERFSFRERRSIHSAASAYVRLFARESIAVALDIDERRLEIVCGHEPTGRVPPVVMLDGSPAPLDVSLSHHAPLLGWALVLDDDVDSAVSK